MLRSFPSRTPDCRAEYLITFLVAALHELATGQYPFARDPEGWNNRDQSSAQEPTLRKRSVQGRQARESHRPPHVGPSEPYPPPARNRPSECLMRSVPVERLTVSRTE